jgi:hypothetical protein
VTYLVCSSVGLDVPASRSPTSPAGGGAARSTRSARTPKRSTPSPAASRSSQRERPRARSGRGNRPPEHLSADRHQRLCSAACSVGLQAAPNGRARQPVHAVPDRPTRQHGARRAPWSPRRRGRTLRTASPPPPPRGRAGRQRAPELIGDACQTAGSTLLRYEVARATVFSWLRAVAIHEAWRQHARTRTEIPAGNSTPHPCEPPPGEHPEPAADLRTILDRVAARMQHAQRLADLDTIMPTTAARCTSRHSATATARSCNSPAPATPPSIADSPNDGARSTSSDMNARTPATPSQRNPTPTWHPGHNRLAHGRPQIRPFPSVTRRSSSRARFGWHAGAPCERSRTVAARPGARRPYRGDFRLRPVARSALGWSARGACAVAVLIRWIASMNARSAMPARPGMTV